MIACECCCEVRSLISYNVSEYQFAIHEALNHVSQLDVTDIYIQKDFTNINKANEKVVEYVTELIKNTKNDA